VLTFLPSLGAMSKLLAACALLALAVPLISAASYQPLSNEALTAAFAADGFTVERWVQYNSHRGAMALSTNATTRSTGLPKPVFYVEGESSALSVCVVCCAVVSIP
jgi:hypothetical protein